MEMNLENGTSQVPKQLSKSGDICVEDDIKYTLKKLKLFRFGEFILKVYIWIKCTYSKKKKHSYIRDIYAIAYI